MRDSAPARFQFHARVAFALAALTTTGCNPPTLACIALARYGVNVTVVDSVTSMPPVVAVRIVARDGAYADSASMNPGTVDPTFGLAAERPGMYTVTVDASGYRPWERDGISVTRKSTSCHELQTVSLTAKLQR